MRVLLTNDDGIYAAGLSALRHEVSREAECLIVAPEREQSAVGHAITLSTPLMVKTARRGGTFWGHAVAGTPADCVKIAVSQLSEEPFDCVISGINRGANVGINVIYSGTVSAATEGTILGLPSIAVSLDSHARDADYSVAARVAMRIAVRMLEGDFPRGVTLNVNVPDLPEEQIKGVRVTRQGTARLRESFEKRVDPRDNAYYWLTGEIIVPEGNEADTDVAALREGYVSVTPVYHDLTRHGVLDSMRERIGDDVL